MWQWPSGPCTGSAIYCSFHGYQYECELCGCDWEEPPPELNIMVNIADVFKDGAEGALNVGDSWRVLKEIWLNIGDIWKRVF